jgi:hypothetical protein
MVSRAAAYRVRLRHDPRQAIIRNRKNADRVLLQDSCAGTPIGNVLGGRSVLLYLGVVRWRLGHRSR